MRTISLAGCHREGQEPVTFFFIKEQCFILSGKSGSRFSSQTASPHRGAWSGGEITSLQQLFHRVGEGEGTSIERNCARIILNIIFLLTP